MNVDHIDTIFTHFLPFVQSSLYTLLISRYASCYLGTLDYSLLAGDICATVSILTACLRLLTPSTSNELIAYKPLQSKNLKQFLVTIGNHFVQQVRESTIKLSINLPCSTPVSLIRTVIQSDLI